MSDKDLRKKLELQQKLKKTTISVIFDERNLPQVKKDIDEMVKKLDKELAEQRKIIAENDRIILEMGYGEEYLKFIRLTRLKLI